jgi:hypothetical protein
MFAFGMLNFGRCCALKLEGKSQVENILICVSSEGCIMPHYTVVARLECSA